MVTSQLHDTPTEWPVSHSEVLHRGRSFSFRNDRVTVPGGDSVDRPYLVHPGSVGVLAMDDRCRVLTIRQYRHPVRHSLWEIPAGRLDVPGESALSAAKRELYEETHHTADDWSPLADFYNSPGSSNELLQVFLAKGVHEADRERYVRKNEESAIEIAWVPLATLVERVLSRELRSPTLVTGVLAAHAVTAPS